MIFLAFNINIKYKNIFKNFNFLKLKVFDSKMSFDHAHDPEMLEMTKTELIGKGNYKLRLKS